jgi:hypothetical protein
MQRTYSPVSMCYNMRSQYTAQYSMMFTERASERAQKISWISHLEVPYKNMSFHIFNQNNILRHVIQWIKIFNNSHKSLKSSRWSFLLGSILINLSFIWKCGIFYGCMNCFFFFYPFTNYLGFGLHFTFNERSPIHTNRPSINLMMMTDPYVAWWNLILSPMKHFDTKLEIWGLKNYITLLICFD